MVVEDITNTQSGCKELTTLGNQLTQLVTDPKQCVLGLTKYRLDRDYIDLKSREDRKLTLEKEIADAEKALKTVDPTIANQFIQPKRDELQSLKAEGADFGQSALQRTEEMIATHTKTKTETQQPLRFAELIGTETRREEMLNQLQNAPIVHIRKGKYKLSPDHASCLAGALGRMRDTLCEKATEGLFLDPVTGTLLATVKESVRRIVREEEILLVETEGGNVSPPDSAETTISEPFRQAIKEYVERLIQEQGITAFVSRQHFPDIDSFYTQFNNTDIQNIFRQHDQKVMDSLKYNILLAIVDIIKAVQAQLKQPNYIIPRRVSEIQELLDTVKAEILRNENQGSPTKKIDWQTLENTYKSDVQSGARCSALVAVGGTTMLTGAIIGGSATAAGIITVAAGAVSMGIGAAVIGLIAATFYGGRYLYKAYQKEPAPQFSHYKSIRGQLQGVRDIYDIVLAFNAIQERQRCTQGQDIPFERVDARSQLDTRPVDRRVAPANPDEAQGVTPHDTTPGRDED